MPRPNSYATVSWSEADLLEWETLVEVDGHDTQTLEEQGLTFKQASTWLARNQKYIQDAMLDAGWQAIETLMDMEDPLEDQ